MLGPVEISGHQIRLRPAELSDFVQWQSVRMANRAHIEPFWVYSGKTWEERHTENTWVRELLDTRRAARRGHSVPLVIEVDGVLRGQCNLTAVDPVNGSAELGVWLDAGLSGRSVGALAAGLMVDFGMDVVGLRRIVAPSARSNGRVARLCTSAGFTRELTLPDFAPVGTGRFEDHDLWVLRPDHRASNALCTWALRLADPTAAPLSVRSVLVDLPGVGPQVRPRSASQATSIVRHRLGKIRRMRRGRGELSLPLVISTERPEVSLRRKRLRDRLRPALRGITTNRPVAVISPVRPGSRFDDAAPRVEFLVLVDGTPVAIISLLGVSVAHSITEIGVVVFDDPRRVHPPSAEQISAAVRAVIEHCVDTLGLDRVAGITDPGDGFATAVATGSGMTRQGILGDAVVREGSTADVALWLVMAETRQSVRTRS
ncbi:GNAT family N-acetyltransferase [Williamsia sp. CHRR-6]|uniref:GNAT family N-acetyltransferase n=1 Tax=Williamsia sp. CHRR-6 TaxID=2835871 RepID=UPI001BD94E61|nr:GNAT family protein [Williamsia sp. CHRR-6]MBT0566285.1 GNAT family N-acetyltransferase [Williamsia sp. CHRR-6]